MVEESSAPTWLFPKEGVKYPMKVDYCPKCSMPFEYCEFYPDFEGCKKWLESNLPSKFSELYVSDGSNREEGNKENNEGDTNDDSKKSRQKRGGKGQVKAKKKANEVERRVALFIVPRGRKKAVTVVQGLKTCGIELKVASKFLGQRFACGASITGDDEIVIQGDFKDDLFEVIPEKWPEVDEDCIEDLGERKR